MFRVLISPEIGGEMLRGFRDTKLTQRAVLGKIRKVQPRIYLPTIRFSKKLDAS